MQNPEISDLLVEKPDEVDRAVNLVYISLVLGVFGTALLLILDGGRSPLGQILVPALFALASVLFLTYKISQGRNWAQVTFKVLFLIGIIPSLITIIQLFSQSPLLGIINTVQSILQLIALKLLFDHNVIAWFKQEK